METATLRDGTTIRYRPDMIGEGLMKEVYFTEDRASVICFFKDAQDANRISRLEAVVNRLNPTRDPATGSYWAKRFCWPTAVVTTPRLGILAPAYPANYLFREGPWSGKEKQGTWFFGSTPSGKPLRSLLPASELGQWIRYFMIAINLARSVRRLHQAGLAHSDLSARNVLVDPCSGESIIIDIDSLVVPGIFPPDVLGTRGYIAPEVVATQHLKLTDPQRVHPSARTDQHALAVLIYQYLLQRHPLVGPRVCNSGSAEEDDLLSMGAKALFIEDSRDTSNRPRDLRMPYTALGPLLGDLFRRSFERGLHSPNDRPAAIEWEKALVKTWDLIVPCSNPGCTHGHFVAHDVRKLRCPFCNGKLAGSMPLLKLRSPGPRAGEWKADGSVAVYHSLGLFGWHAFSNQSANETADRTPLAYCMLHGGKWLLINHKLPDLVSPAGSPVVPGQAIELVHGAQFRLSTQPHGRSVDVEIHR